jgi:hypothetical protein
MNRYMTRVSLGLAAALGASLLITDAHANATYTLGLFTGGPASGSVSLTVDPTPASGFMHFAEGGGLLSLDIIAGPLDFTLADSLGGAFVDFDNGYPVNFNYIGMLLDGSVFSATNLTFTFAGTSGTTTSGAIPEPAGIVVLLAGVLGFVFAGGRRR